MITSNSKSMGGLPERLDWLKIPELKESETTVYPTFFADELINLPLHAKHVVTYESGF